MMTENEYAGNTLIGNLFLFVKFEPAEDLDKNYFFG
jgi:hypothetical protein